MELILAAAVMTLVYKLHMFMEALRSHYKTLPEQKLKQPNPEEPAVESNAVIDIESTLTDENIGAV